jgi:hypothetical protein
MDSRTSQSPHHDAAQETAAGEVQPQDQASALVAREWTRTTRRGGKLTERPMIGQEVEATFLDRHGGLQRVSGIVRRNDARDLVVRSGDGAETAVTRDANVTAKSR